MKEAFEREEILILWGVELLEDLEQNRELGRGKRGIVERDCNLLEAKQHLLEENCLGMTLSHFKFTFFFFFFTLSYYVSY